MSEEMNKRNSELTDAELTNVSGGHEGVDAMRNAWDCCGGCPYTKYCNHGLEELIQYNQSHDDIEYFWDCPFVEEAEGRSKT